LTAILGGKLFRSSIIGGACGPCDVCQWPNTTLSTPHKSNVDMTIVDLCPLTNMLMTAYFLPINVAEKVAVKSLIKWIYSRRKYYHARYVQKI